MTLEARGASSLGFLDFFSRKSRPGRRSGVNPAGVDRDTRIPIMTRKTANTFGQPTLEDLMVRFLANRSDAVAAAVEPGEGEAGWSRSDDDDGQRDRCRHVTGSYLG